MKIRFTKPSSKIIELGRYSHAKNPFQEEVSVKKREVEGQCSLQKNFYIYLKVKEG